MATVNAGVDYCKNQRPLQDCFFIGDMGSITSDGTPTGPTSVALARRDDATPSVNTIASARAFATSGVGGTTLNRAAGDYGAVYFPWIYAPDPIGAGRNPKFCCRLRLHGWNLCAHRQFARRVQSAGGNRGGRGGSAWRRCDVSDVEQDQLNPVSVNVIRTVPGSGFVVWGTRTFGSDASWRYIPVRRMAIFLRVSIYYGIQWAVFEPNDEPLWAELRLNIRSFMLTQFRAGAFQGSQARRRFLRQMRQQHDHTAGHRQRCRQHSGRVRAAQAGRVRRPQAQPEGQSARSLIE